MFLVELFACRPFHSDDNRCALKEKTMDSSVKPKRGLMALLANTSKNAPAATDAIPASGTTNPNDGLSLLEVPIQTIRANPHQPRTEFDTEALNELAASIKAQGIIQPAVVRPLKPEEVTGEHRYELIAGERRWRASQLAGLTAIPVVIKSTFEDRDILLLSLVENLQRDDLNPIEEALAYDRLAKTFNLTQDQIADGVGKSRTTVANTMRLLDLPQSVQDALKSKKLTTGHAKALLAVPNPKIQSQLAAKAQAEGLTVRDLERLITADRPKAKGGALTRPSRIMTRNYVSSDHQEVEKRLREHFGTRVRVEDGATAGRVIIEFYSIEDFQRIIKLMGAE
jgi:ParB family chromosome partitioning protein